MVLFGRVAEFSVELWSILISIHITIAELLFVGSWSSQRFSFHQLLNIQLTLKCPEMS